MRKLGLICGMVLWGAVVWASPVSVISVTDEDKHTVKEDFTHTFEYFIYPLSSSAKTSGSKCQATRITRRWFATAAHCVSNACANGCRIQMDLLEYPISALAEVKHTPKQPAVFVHPGFLYHVFVKDDLALIRLDLDRAPLTYYKRNSNAQAATRTLLTKQQFEQFLAKTPAARSALYRVKSPSFPPLLVFDNHANYLLKNKISVISIFDGTRSVKPNPNPVHYVKNLEFAYTKNFGIRRGMSGSGVMSNTGEFVGIISGIFQMNQKAASARPEELFMFFAFNTPAVEFMKQVMGSDFYKLDMKDAYPQFVSKSRQDHSKIIHYLDVLKKQAAPAAQAR